MLRNPAGRAGTQPTGCLSAPARTFAAPAPWGWLGGFAMQGSTPGALSTIRCGWRPPSQPMGSEKRYSPGTLPNQAFRASPAPRGHRPPTGGKNKFLPPRARRKGVLWAPLDELRAPVLLSTNELLWLPRSPDPRPAMGRAEKATRTSPVSEQVRSRCFCAHFLHSNRAVALLMPQIRLPQAAGPSFPLLSFLAKARRNKAPETRSAAVLGHCCLFAL